MQGLLRRRHGPLCTGLYSINKNQLHVPTIHIDLIADTKHEQIVTTLWVTSSCCFGH